MELSSDLGTYNESLGNRISDDIRKLKKNRRKLADVLGKLKAYRLAKQMESLANRLLRNTDLAGPVRQDIKTVNNY